jgi:hypothetical protein
MASPLTLPVGPVEGYCRIYAALLRGMRRAGRGGHDRVVLANVE